MDSCVAEYVLLGEVAKQVYDGLVSLEASEIEIGMTRNGCNTYMRETLGTFYKHAVIGEDNIKFNIGEIPVTIHFLENDNRFIKHPDTRFFFAESFKIPNPFNEYWEERNIK